jgi:hypothetical protein
MALATAEQALGGNVERAEIEAALAEVEATHEPWHAWIGASGILYARRPMSSPPRVVRAESPDQLAAAIEDCERYLAAR